jgi:hypothetical protein
MDLNIKENTEENQNQKQKAKGWLYIKIQIQVLRTCILRVMTLLRLC